MKKILNWDHQLQLEIIMGVNKSPIRHLSPQNGTSSDRNTLHLTKLLDKGPYRNN